MQKKIIQTVPVSINSFEDIIEARETFQRKQKITFLCKNCGNNFLYS